MTITMMVNDRYTVNRSERVTTDAGYLIVPASIARTGIQQYTSNELGLEGKNRIVNVYRAPEDVFSEDSLKTYKTAVLTNGHPTEPVTANNSKKYSVGFIDGEVVKAEDGSRLNANLIFTDSETIKAIEAGKEQISVGYKNVLEACDITIDGFKCEYKQTKINANHIALVERGRAGASCSLSDSAIELQKLLNDEEENMEEDPKKKENEEEPKKNGDKGSEKDKPKKKENEEESKDPKKKESDDENKEKDTKDSADNVELSEAEKMHSTYTATLDAYKDQVDSLTATVNDQKVTIDELNTQLVEKGKLFPTDVTDSDSLEEYIITMADERVELMTTIDSLGVDVDITNKSSNDIKRDVVSARFPDLPKEKLTNDSYVSARFDVLVETKDSGESTTLRKILQDSATPTETVVDTADEETVDPVEAARQRKIARNHK